MSDKTHKTPARAITWNACAVVGFFVLTATTALIISKNHSDSIISIGLILIVANFSAVCIYNLFNNHKGIQKNELVLLAIIPLVASIINIIIIALSIDGAWYLMGIAVSSIACALFLTRQSG